MGSVNMGSVNMGSVNMGSVNMGSVLFLLIVCICWTQTNAAYNCTACEKRKCPPLLTPCGGRRAIDPCGCCKHCAKEGYEVCGGPDWELGYCDRGLRCANITGTELVEIPNTGICKVFPGRPQKEYYEDDDENCPVQTGCYRMMGTCECPGKRTCVLDFQLDKYDRLHCDPFYFDNLKRLCANVTCPEVKVPTCPPDSVLTKPHTPYGECCPTIPSYCTCHFERCVNNCPNGKRKVTILKTKGEPGSCCDLNLCLL
ncbi:cysteine-rich motor neuron 1 protein-like isoform X2 [Rana temporaria]|uniref:cysteine-rich motor neuron 1 protein-like isoform X2 n=1 Tax=Rana temporaria TaxID=8407 RepID=UPI001AAD689C|nr:cysteine-rich motor neuron 1 protein-like isoform X2 [Rana temporaria]